MQQILPVQLKNLAKACPFPLYAVGGACRDFLAGLEPKERDWDICAPVPFELFARVAAECGWRVAAMFARTGSVKAEYDGLACEFTSFRSDVYAEGGHSPSEVKFTFDMAEDARRRDFTPHAVFTLYSIISRKFRNFKILPHRCACMRTKSGAKFAPLRQFYMFSIKRDSLRRAVYFSGTISSQYPSGSSMKYMPMSGFS